MDEIPLDDLVLALRASPGNDTMLGLLANKLGEDNLLDKSDVKNVIDEIFSQLKFCAGRGEVEHLCCIVLSNLTIMEEHCAVLLEGDIKYLVEKFLAHNPQKENQTIDYTKADVAARADPWAYVGSILCNVCRLEGGRKLLLNISSGYIPKLASQLRSLYVVRRHGAIASIRSCLFDNEVHWWMIHEAKIMYYILFPLVPAVSFDENDKEGMDPRLWVAADDNKKCYEPDVTVRKMLCESIVLMCQKKETRKTLRKMKVYPIVRNLDLEQDDEGVSEVILEIVQMMMRDEEGEVSGWDEPLREIKTKISKEEEEKGVPESVLDLGMD